MAIIVVQQQACGVRFIFAEVGTTNLVDNRDMMSSSRRPTCECTHYERHARKPAPHILHPLVPILPNKLDNNYCCMSDPRCCRCYILAPAVSPAVARNNTTRPTVGWVHFVSKIARILDKGQWICCAVPRLRRWPLTKSDRID